MEIKIDLDASRTILSRRSLALTNLDLYTGVGDLDLDLSGARSPRRYDFSTGHKMVPIDLAGDWQDASECIK